MMMATLLRGSEARGKYLSSSSNVRMWTGRKLSHLDKQFNVNQTDLPTPINQEDFD
jgi:hypothetical protein